MRILSLLLGLVGLVVAAFGVTLLLVSRLVLGATPHADRAIQIPIVMSEAPPEPTKDVPLPRYDELHDAAAAAAQMLYACSHYYECGNIIAQDPNGKYVVGRVLASMDHGDEVQIPHGVPAGWKFIAEAHSHPCLKDSHEVPFFSPQDLMGYVSGRFTGYMLDQCTGDVHEFVPGRDSPNELEMPGNPGTFSTHGVIVAHIPVDGKSVEPVTYFPTGTAN